MSALNGLELVNALEQHPVTYRDTPVVTFSLVDHMHGRREGHAKDTFGRNRVRFTEGKHYFRVVQGELSKGGALNTPAGNLAQQAVYLLTQRGYTMLVKSFRDDLSWEIQDRLSDTYWKSQQRTDELDRMRDHCARIEGAMLALLNQRERESREKASSDGRALNNRKSEIALQKQCRDLIGQPFWSAEDLFGQEYLAIDEQGNLTTDKPQLAGPEDEPAQVEGGAE